VQKFLALMIASALILKKNYYQKLGNFVQMVLLSQIFAMQLCIIAYKNYYSERAW